MNEAREIRLRLLELIGRDGGLHPDTMVETVLGLERFVMDAGVAKIAAPADSAASSETDGTGPA